MLIEIRRYCVLTMSRKRGMQSCCNVCSAFSLQTIGSKTVGSIKVFFSESTYCVDLARDKGAHIVNLDLNTWDEMPMRSASNGVLPATTPFVDVESAGRFARSI